MGTRAPTPLGGIPASRLGGSPATPLGGIPATRLGGSPATGFAGAAGGRGGSGRSRLEASDPTVAVTLAKFKAQYKKVWQKALDEIQSGRKRTDWSWWIWPTNYRHGATSTSRAWALSDEAARAFMNDGYLRECWLRMMTAVADKLEAGVPVRTLCGIDGSRVSATCSLMFRVTGGADQEVSAVCKRVSQYIEIDLGMTGAAGGGAAGRGAAGRGAAGGGAAGRGAAGRGAAGRGATMSSMAQSVSTPIILQSIRLNGVKICISAGNVLDFGEGTGWDRTRTAVVNAANRGGLGGGGIDKAFMQAGGPNLAKDRKALPILSGPGHDRIREGGAVATFASAPYADGGKALYAMTVIHAVGPNYPNIPGAADDVGDFAGKDAKLTEAYATTMRVARDRNIQYLGMPLISAGAFRGSRSLRAVATIAINAVEQNIYDGLIEVHLIAFDQTAIEQLKQAFTSLH